MGRYIYTRNEKNEIKEGDVNADGRDEYDYEYEYGYKWLYLFIYCSCITQQNTTEPNTRDNTQWTRDTVNTLAIQYKTIQYNTNIRYNTNTLQKTKNE